MKNSHDYWPQGMALLAGALRAGLTIPQAIGALLADGPAPLTQLLKNRAAQAQGQSARARIEILFADEQLALCRAALLIAQAEGGKAAELLTQAARIMRKEAELRRKARVLSAQGRATAWIVGLAPLFMFLLFSWISPEFMRPLVQSSTGWTLLAMVVVLIVVGLLSVKKMLEIE
jgi:tight adherence protein B